MRAPPESRLEHDAFVYTTSEELLADAVPFIRDGLGASEPVLAAPTSANADLLRKELGVLADAVDWATHPERHRPVERLALFVRYAENMLARGARRIRLLGEPAWPASASSPAAAEWKRLESYFNQALAPYPIWLVCPYARELPEGIVAEARHTHPVIGHLEARRESGDYLDPNEFACGLDRVPLPEPPHGLAEITFSAPSDLRSFVANRAEAAGLLPEVVQDLKLAVGEVGANVFRHADGIPRVRVWVADDVFVCEVRDGGPGIGDPFAGYVVPGRKQAGRWGLSIARRLCDAVEIRSSVAGTCVRLHLNLC